MSNVEKPAGVGASQTTDADFVEDVSGKLAMTHFHFQHPVFRAPGAKFLMNSNRRAPAFSVDVGEMAGLIEIDVLIKNFNIAHDHPDSQLIAIAVEGLRYVPDIKPGDSIPSEILTGEASWSVEAKHKTIADQRLQAQLFSAMSGREILLTDPNEISMFLGQIENKEKLKSCFSDAAVALGFDAKNTEIVVTRLELLARELSYIEALRERMARVSTLQEKLALYRKRFGGDRETRMELQRIYQLMNLGIREYTELLAEADCQTGEILSALKTIDRQISYIRKVRDNLYYLLMQWEPHIKDLDVWTSSRTNEIDRAVSALYRFLAPKFTSGRSMMNRRSSKQASLSAPKLAGKSLMSR